MYEIWLAMNIVWEIARGMLPLLLSAAVVWALLMVAAWRRRGGWAQALPLTLVVGAVATVLATLLLPGWNKSSFAEMGYWVDWANLVAMAAGIGALVAAFVWPLLAMRLPARPA